MKAITPLCRTILDARLTIDDVAKGAGVEVWQLTTHSSLSSAELARVNEAIAAKKVELRPGGWRHPIDPAFEALRSQARLDEKAVALDVALDIARRPYDPLTIGRGSIKSFVPDWVKNSGKKADAAI